MCDLEIDDYESENDVKEILNQPGATSVEFIKSDKTKRVVKGERLHMYPVDMNIYSKSCGITYPKRMVKRYSDIRKKMKFVLKNIMLRSLLKCLMLKLGLKM